ncbi:MAG TPA: GGDEF domain-containing protein [Povalibacter sp.]|nr:GGDEF domain-containing protein [Povalibacter sp.]
MTESIPIAPKPLTRRPSWPSRLWSRLIPPLAFDPVMEAQFRQWYTQHVRSRIRNVIWIPTLALLVALFAGGPIDRLRGIVFGVDNQTAVDLLRGLIAPSCVALLVVAYTRLYDRWFSLAARIVAPIHAISFVAIDILMNAQGYSFSALMPLVVLGPYFLFGLQQAQAVGTALLVVAAYAIGGYLAGIDGGQRWFDITVVLFTGCMGAAVHYSLLKSLRHTYISTQLLSESANRDPLTGIHNRRRFDEHAARVWQQASRTGVPVALLMIDIDHFKPFNDHGGHQAGDACLIEVASVIGRAARRPLDLVARYGGEEFAVLLYDAHRERAEDLCHLLHAHLADKNLVHPAFSGERVTFSIGGACVTPHPLRRVEGLIQLADEALYAAKERGRNRSVIMDQEYDTLDTGAFRAGRNKHNAVA